MYVNEEEVNGKTWWIHVNCTFVSHTTRGGPGTMAGEEEGKGVGKRGGKEMDGKGKGM